MNYFKSAIIIFCASAGLLALSQPAEAQSYYAAGILKSKNVLSLAEVDDITEFRVAASVPASTTVSISFSQDRAVYYSASGTKGAWTDCATGTTVIDMSELAWTGALLFIN
jgi:hypothetical protein